VNPRIRLLALVIGAVFMVFVTTSLGFWQLRRAAEKIALQEAMEGQGLKAPLSALQLKQTVDPVTLVHQRVRLRGTWAAASTVFLDNRQMDAKVGFFVLTPLVLEGGGAVLVQRGWAPRNFESRTQLPPVDTPAGLVDIEGRIALPPSKLFEPGAAVAGTIRQNLDLVQFQKETGLPLIAVTVLQTGAPSEGLRRDWPAVQLGVDKHYGYAFQWFALAALVAALTLWFQIIRPFYLRSPEPH
jgi:surfeit locus 1 family protein